MYVSRVPQTSSSGTLRSAGVVSGWLLTTAAVGAFAFAVGDNADRELAGQVITPAATVAVETANTGSLGSVLTHAKVTAAVVNATRTTGQQPGCRRVGSADHVRSLLIRERAVQSSNRRGPRTLARAADFTCPNAVTATFTGTRVGSVPGSGLPGRASLDGPR
ncbi:hypothetical protein [Williamsia muralis]|uniref:hypothetical protein n=1 Tax=Williamsia marianensis TaxID=85044 RepID=UPI000DE75147|nr:hypothetical protein [Williamsia marianensis]PVY34230.1 hypothetical protein C7458_101639 [Williamsia marianensis]